MSQEAWVAAQQRLARERGGVPKKTTALQAEWQAMRLRQRRAASVEARAALAALPDVHTQLARQLLAVPDGGLRIGGTVTGRTSAKLAASVAAAGNNDPGSRNGRLVFLDEAGGQPAAAAQPKRLKPEVAERMRQLQEQAQALMETCTEVRNNPQTYTTAQAKRLLEDRIALTRGTINAFVSSEGLNTDRMKHISKQHESQLLAGWGRTVRRRMWP